MKITIYELIGLIKDGKAPKKIKYMGKVYKKNTIILLNGEEYFDYFNIFEHTLLFTDEINIIMSLNEKIETIGEDKKIERANIKLFEETGKAILSSRIKEYNSYNFKELKRVTDELIDEINNLKEND